MEKRKYCRYYKDDSPLKSMPKSTLHYQTWIKKSRLLSSEEVRVSMSDATVSSKLGEDNDSDTMMESAYDHGVPEIEEEFSDTDFFSENDTFADDTDNEISDSEDSANQVSQGKLFEGCPLSSDESAILVLQYAVTHKVTGKALVSLLHLLKAHFPQGTEYFTYMNQLKSFFYKCAEIPLEIIKFCNTCLTQIQENRFCPKCNKYLQDGHISQFIKLSIVDQIQSFFDDQEFIDLINYRFKRAKRNFHSIEDVYDGAMYQALFKDGCLLNNEFNLSLKVNTDGVSIFKSSSYHLWPIYFQVNELPPDRRILSKYRILAGMWCGRKKPDMSLMFSPLVADLKCLEEHGHLFYLPDGREVQSCLIVLTGHFDTPAKDDFLHKVHHNGFYGCSFCEDKGKSVKSGKGYTHVYPYNAETATGFSQARSCESVKCNAANAILTGKPVCGIKKLCPFSELKYFDIVKSISVDYMHTVCLGVMKRLLTIWFNVEHRSHPAYIGSKVKEVDQQLIRITPPNSVTRTPRSISDNLKHYKASELKMWLLHYGPVCLADVLPHKYFNHFLYLSKGIYLLLSKSISVNDLKESDKCLQSFCLLTEQLYGERFMTINFHLLLHTVESVRQLGPLWSSSCFAFEDYDRELGDYFHGTQYVEKQILSAVAFCQKLPFYTRKFQNNMIAANLLEALSNKYKCTLKEKLDDGVYVVGATVRKKFCTLPQEDKSAMQELLPVHGQKFVKTFNRVYLHGSIFHSASYQRVSKRNSFSVMYKDQDSLRYGQIKYYYQLADENGSVTCALLQSFTVLSKIQNEHTSLQIAHVELEDNLKAVQLNSISQKCVFMNMGDKKFLSVIPNNYECD